MKVGVLINITDNYREIILDAKKNGFDFGQLVMWNPDFYTDENAKELKAFLEEVDFKAVSFWCGWSGVANWGYPEMYQSLGLVPDWLRDRRLNDLKRGAEFAHKLGIELVTTHAGYLPDDPNHPTHVAIVAALKELCLELQKRGQKFSFETGEELPLTLSLMIKDIGLDNVGVNFDPANLYINGRGNPLDAMDLLGCKVFGMHAKDAVPATFGNPKGKEMQIGQGKVDFKALLTKLKEYGYEGDILIEREIPYGEERNKQIRESKVYLEKIIDEVFN